MEHQKWVEQYFEVTHELFENTAKQIWDFAETKYQEHRSSELLIKLLEAEDFVVEKGVAGIPTAFIGSFGTGKPCIGILGEYDALPALSQEACSQKQPVVDGANGHGCGHNLLGTGSIAAALAVKTYMKENNISGTIRFYGCPAEESGGSGKVFMARSGCFDDLDAAFSWHPSDYNETWDVTTLANIQGKFTFKGVSAHAAACPQLGRSALDSAEIMGVGTNYLREHIIPEARIHYAYLNAGAPVANVVHDYTKLQYNIRTPKLKDAKEIFARVIDIAKGSALINGTEMSYEICGGTHEILLNDTLGMVVSETFSELGASTYSDEENKTAKEFFDTFPPNVNHGVKKRKGENFNEEKPLDNSVRKYNNTNRCMSGSTDIGEVSQIVPTVQLTAACTAMGTAAHSWQFTAQCGSPIGMKGMLKAGEVISLSMIKVLENPEILVKAKAEFLETLEEKYECPFDDSVKPEIGGVQ